MPSDPDEIYHSNFYFHEKASFTTKGFSPLYSETAPSHLTQSITELSFGLFFSSLNIDLSILGVDDDFTFTGGHSIIIPKDTPGIKFEDMYTMIPGESGNNFYRSDSFAINNKDNTPLLNLLTSAYTLESILIQNWNITTHYLYKKLISWSSSTSYVVSSDSYQDKGEWYIPAWIWEFQFMVPIKESLLNEHSGKLSTDFQLGTRPVEAGLLGNITIGSNNIDEFISNLSFNIVTKEDKTEYNSEIKNYMSFADSKKNQFQIENHLLFSDNDFFTITDFGTLSYIWNIIPKKHIPLPFIPKEVIEKNYFSHEESLSYSVSNYEDSQILNHINLLLGHSTSLQFPPHGYIKTGIILGFDFESIEMDYSSFEALGIAIQAGIEAHIQW